MSVSVWIDGDWPVRRRGLVDGGTQFGNDTKDERVAIAQHLLSHIDMFRDFISEHQNRDSFMEVEEEDHLQFRALYESCRTASLYLEKNWEMDSLDEVYKKDRAKWKSETVWLHEQTLDYALQEIESSFRVSYARQPTW